MKRINNLLLILISIIFVFSMFGCITPEPTTGDISFDNNNSTRSYADIKVRINDSLVTFPSDQRPIIMNSRTLLPMNFVFSTLGFDVNWAWVTISGQQVMKVWGTKGDQSIEFWINKNYAKVNGDYVNLDVAPIIYNSRTYIPVYVVGLTNVASVNWVNQTRTVNIYNWDELHYGLYWLGKNGDYQKANPNEYNPFYNRYRKTVIISFGWQPGGVSTKARPTTRWIVDNIDVWTQNTWIDQGWNVGVFMWTQLADESLPWDAESKIWSTNSSVGTRWKKSDGSFETTNVPNQRVGELFYNEYTNAMSNYAGSYIRMVGYSFGHQLVAYVQKKLTERGQSHLVADRLAYCDPAWTSGEFQFYLNNESDYIAYKNDDLYGPAPSLVTSKLVAYCTKYIIENYNIPVEQYKSSLLSGSLNYYNNLDSDSCLVRLKPWYYSSWDVANKHGAALMWYMWSKSFNAPPEYKRNWKMQVVPTGLDAASASTSDARIKQMQDMNMTMWTQYTGVTTPNIGDDTLERVLNIED